MKPTFAISLHDEPASRMVFNLCSSAGDHGVFVLDFFTGGGDELNPSAPDDVRAAFPGVPDEAIGGPEARRFLLFVGVAGTANPPVFGKASPAEEDSMFVGRFCSAEDGS
jgi:hypothetical protein